MRKTTKITVVGTSVAALMGAGIAYAAWTSTGSGNGTATAGSDTNFTVTASDATGLFPTGNQPVTVTVKNNNPYKVQLSSVVPGAITVDKAACSAGSVTTPALSGLSDVLQPSGTAGDSTTYTFTVSMDNNAEQACEGAKFTIPFTATGASSN